MKKHIQNPNLHKNVNMWNWNESSNILLYTYTYKQSFQMLSGSCGRLHEMFATSTYFGES